MGLMKTLGTGQGYLKAGFLGFPKAGKTYTACELAVGTRAFFKHEGAIAMFDTEGGSEYIAPRIKKETGKDLLGIRSRSLGDLLTVAKECIEGNVSVLIVDSMTHIWREVCDAYLAEVNAYRKTKKLYPRTKLEFQDWNPIKAKFGEWTDFYLNSPLHIIICGRAGYEYDHIVNEETGKKELQKTGVKMKTESEFGFEPSLLIEMEREQTRESSKPIVHRATVIGDRFGIIDGKTCDDPTFKFFLPHINMLKAGAHAPIDTSIKTVMGVDEVGDDEYRRFKKEQTILLEEIQNEMLKRWPSTSAVEKQAKVRCIELLFQTSSWTKVESLRPPVLRRGLGMLRATPVDKEAIETLAKIVDLDNKPLEQEIVDTAFGPVAEKEPAQA